MSVQVKGYICFYADHMANDFVSIDDEVFMEFEQVLVTLQSGVLEYPKNIWGIIDERGNSLQFFVNDDGSIEMNISVPEKFGSYTKAIDIPECYAIVSQAHQYFENIEMDDAEFSGWWLD